MSSRPSCARPRRPASCRPGWTPGWRRPAWSPCRPGWAPASWSATATPSRPGPSSATSWTGCYPGPNRPGHNRGAGDQESLADYSPVTNNTTRARANRERRKGMADSDVIVVGAGLAGLVATAELADAGRRVLLLDQEPATNLGGQAFWSFGGLFLIDSPEQRRFGIKDSFELARQDWLGSAGFDRGIDDPAGPDYWAYRWAEAYLDFAAGEKRAWLHGQGLRWVPLVGWAERGGYLADGPGNSVPRFHVTWGTGPAVVAPVARRARAAAFTGRVQFGFRHRVDELTVTNGAVDGVRGAILEPSSAARGHRSSRTETGQFERHAPVVLVTAGGIGA